MYCTKHVNEVIRSLQKWLKNKPTKKVILLQNRTGDSFLIYFLPKKIFLNLQEAMLLLSDENKLMMSFVRHLLCF